MWNDWVAKAKNVAANIDKQLNESVGMDDHGKTLSVSSSSSLLSSPLNGSATNAATSTTSTSPVTTTPNDYNWNTMPATSAVVTSKPATTATSTPNLLAKQQQKPLVEDDWNGEFDDDDVMFHDMDKQESDTTTTTAIPAISGNTAPKTTTTTTTTATTPAVATEHKPKLLLPVKMSELESSLEDNSTGQEQPHETKPTSKLLFQPPATTTTATTATTTKDDESSTPTIKQEPSEPATTASPPTTILQTTEEPSSTTMNGTNNKAETTDQETMEESTLETVVVATQGKEEKESIQGNDQSRSIMEEEEDNNSNEMDSSLMDSQQQEPASSNNNNAKGLASSMFSTLSSKAAAVSSSTSTTSSSVFSTLKSSAVAAATSTSTPANLSSTASNMFSSLKSSAAAAVTTTPHTLSGALEQFANSQENDKEKYASVSGVNDQGGWDGEDDGLDLIMDKDDNDDKKNSNKELVLTQPEDTTPIKSQTENQVIENNVQVEEEPVVATPEIGNDTVVVEANEPAILTTAPIANDASVPGMDVTDATTTPSPSTVVAATTTPLSSTAPTTLQTTVLDAAAGLAAQQKIDELTNRLVQRENQLEQKAQQLSQLEQSWQTEKDDLKKQIEDTKAEAKKRILRAKERFEAAQQEAAAQQSMIEALRSEGETLAKKQSDMERAVRSSKGDVREWMEKCHKEEQAKKVALEKIEKLQTELKDTQESLSAARKGESQAGQYHDQLLTLRSELDSKTATILHLEQSLKEATSETKELTVQLEESQKTAEQLAQQNAKKMRKEHSTVLSDLEQKLRQCENDAMLREDSLRQEVTELRKRWQDAVRRADGLSMDVQSSTAPLLRQLESMERQGRVRAAAWAEMETKLRSELEETIIQNEMMAKERTDVVTKMNRLERYHKEQETEYKACKLSLEEALEKNTSLERQIRKQQEEIQQRQKEYQDMERLANEGVARVRNEMTQTVVDSEERYRSQIESLRRDYEVELDKRQQLEVQVSQLLAATTTNSANNPYYNHPHSIIMDDRDERGSQHKKLIQSEGQADILAGALVGIGGGGDEYEDDDEPHKDTTSKDDGTAATTTTSSSSSSFAAMEQLQSRLKIAKVELDALRSNLRESERSRESLVEELAHCRHAQEELPKLEEELVQLRSENKELNLEVTALREDIAEVRQLYRTQLNVLLEEKAAAFEQPPQVEDGNDEKDQPNVSSVVDGTEGYEQQQVEQDASIAAPE